MAFQLDSRVPLTAQAPEPFNGLQALGQIRAQQEAQQFRQQQMASQQAIEEERRGHIAKAERDAKQEAALRDLFANADGGIPKPSQIMGIVGPERGVKIVDGLSALRKHAQGEYEDTQKLVRNVLLGVAALPEGIRAESYPSIRGTLIQRGVISEQDAPAEYDPQWFAQALKFGQEPEKVGTTTVDVRNPDGSTTKKIVENRPGQEFTSAAPPVPAPTNIEAAILDAQRKGDGAEVRRLLNLKGQVTAAGRAPATDNEPLVSIMGPDGRPVYVPRSHAVGKQPASGREQGRAVTSSDASDLADFDTSKDELAAVRAAISDKDSTGIVARVGATLPYVTQITGWGADAKKRQAVIDRVKQVIGKTLEGGVLRKEDEAKYEKILPNIGDAPDVAASKLNGLDAAIDKRKQRRLDALADAGYDTAKFTARGGGGKVTVTAPDGSKHDFASQAEADAFKKLAGIP